MPFSSYIYDVAVLPGPQALVLRSNKFPTKPNILERWSLASGKRLLEVSAQAQFAHVLAASEDVAVTGDTEGLLRVWSLPSLECRRVIDLRGKPGKGQRGRSRLPICAISLLDAGPRALVATGDNAFGLWDLDSGKRLRSYRQKGHFVNSFAVLAGGTRFLSTSLDRTVRLWEMESGECHATLLEAGLPPFTPRYEAQDDQSPTGVCVLRDGRRAVSSHGDGTFRCWDLETGALLHKARTNGNPAWFTSVAASAEADLAIAGAWDHNAWLWEPGSEPVALSGHIGEVMAARFLPASGLAVSGSFDQTLRVWDIRSRACLRVIGRPVESSQWPPNESRW